MQIDVLIINASSRPHVYGALAPLAAVEIPVWAGLLCAALRALGFSAEVWDAEVEGETPEQTAKHINRLRPRIAVFSVYGQQPSASTQCLPAAEAVARLCEVPTLALGAHPSA